MERVPGHLIPEHLLPLQAYDKLVSCTDPDIKDDLRMRYRQLVQEQSALEKRRDLEARIMMGATLKSSSK